MYAIYLLTDKSLLRVVDTLLTPGRVYQIRGYGSSTTSNSTVST